DERAAELAVLRSRAQRPAHGVDHAVEWPRHLPDLLDAERPHLRVVACQAEAVESDTGEVSLRSFRQDSYARDDVGARLEVAERLAVATSSLVTRANAARATVRDEQLLRRSLGQDHCADCLRLLRQPPA